MNDSDVNRAPAESGRDWVSFVAPDGDSWMFDLTFFRSNYRCIYGQGCAGIEEHPDPDLHRGCCSYGAHFVDDADLTRVMGVASTLTAEQWHNAGLFPELGAHGLKDRELIEALTFIDDDEDRVTKVVDGACVFLNPPDASTGPGCALHFAAEDAGVNPLEWKPEVCWQVPIRVEHHVDDNGGHTHFVRQWTRDDWGPDSGIGWWCAEAPEAYSATTSAAHTLHGEIEALAGTAIADALVAHIEGKGTVVSLPLPTRKGS